METREELLRAKIPCPETGIEIKRTLCAICSPSFHCGVDAYVKDGRIIKVEGIDGHPMNNGLLCTKGLSNREYIYRKDRILTPLKRVGGRGEGTGLSQRDLMLQLPLFFKKAAVFVKLSRKGFQCAANTAEDFLRLQGNLLLFRCNMLLSHPGQFF